MRHNPREYDDGLERCACGNAASRLSTCAHPGCEARLCWVCATECGASAGCGMFCAEHVSEINMGTVQRPCVVQACARCEVEVLDETETVSEQGRLAA